MYLLDSDVLIEASRHYYAFDIAPGFWTWLASPSLAGQVASVQAVQDEIVRGTGDLVSWAQERPESFWLPESDEVVAAMARLSGWAVEPARGYRQAAVDEFFDSADYRLIAHALATGSTIVTRERPAPGAQKKIKIPDACGALGVACIDPFRLYRLLGLRLVA